MLLNKDKEVDIGKDLKEFKEFTNEFPPEVRLEVAAADLGLQSLMLVSTVPRRDSLQLGCYS